MRGEYLTILIEVGVNSPDQIFEYFRSHQNAQYHVLLKKETEIDVLRSTFLWFLKL